MARKPRKPDPRTDAPPRPPDETELDDALLDRNEELSLRPEIKDCLLELYKDIEKGFENQETRANDSMDYWDVYNCKLGPKQYYSGTSKIFLPIVHDAVNARAVRFTNQIFPQAGRYIEVTSEDGTLPHGEMSLLEHYIRRAKLRTQVVPALCRNGDVEGQYNVYVDWRETERHVVWKKQKKARPDQLDAEEAGTEEPEDIQTKTLKTGRPHVEVLSDSDVLLLPQTAESVQDALRNGGSATILRRWSKAKIKQLIEDEEIDAEAGKTLLSDMKAEKQMDATNKSKRLMDAAGIKGSGDSKHALVYETWTLLTIKSNENPDGERRLCKAYFGSEKVILSCKRNPNWSDKCNLISAPVDKLQSIFKGRSKIAPIEQVQYWANDVCNEAADSSAFSMMPIVMTDPEKNPRVGTMVLSLAAVWETNPQDTQFAKFPDIWKSGFEIINGLKAQIMQTLSVSPAAITQSTQQKNKPSQADVAREQQVDILTTADACTILEEGILTPIVQFMLELDHQHRKDSILIRQFGEMGLRAKMDWVPPINMDKIHHYQWFGVERARNQMQMQQQIAGIGVITKIPPQMYQGFRLNMVPILTNMVEGLFGPRLAPLIFVDEAKEVTLEADMENQFLYDGMDLPIHPQDKDQEHIAEHQKLLQELGGDANGNIERHIQRHMIQMQLKQRAQMEQALQQMMNGPQQQGQQQGKGRAGAQQKGPRGNGQGPPGMIHRDQIGPQSGQPPALRGGNGAPGGMG
jgi:hypothetical protein